MYEQINILGGRLTKDQIQALLKRQTQKEGLTDNMKYYAGENVDIGQEYANRAAKGTEPNKVLPSAYAATLSDTAASFSFSDIEYIDDKDDAWLKEYKRFLVDNDTDIKNYRLGLYQVAYGMAYAIHYVDKSEAGNQYRYEIVNDPRQIIAVFSTSLKTELQCFIHIHALNEGYYLEIYYPDKIEEWEVKSVNRLKDFQRVDDDRRLNDFGRPPLEYYYNNFDPIQLNCVFQKVKPYIAAVDAILTGTWNEIEKHANAILIAMKRFREEDVADMKSKRTLSVGSKEESDATKFLTKEVQYGYIEWYYKALVYEIHKHTHILDYQNPDAGYLTGESGKALRYRHTDMMNLARRLEMYNREGQYQRIRLYNAISGKGEKDFRDIQIKYNRTLPDDLEERITAVKGTEFLSNYTKAETAGFDPETEKERMTEETDSLLDMEGVRAEQTNND